LAPEAEMVDGSVRLDAGQAATAAYLGD
jgi:hypothetical protein